MGLNEIMVFQGLISRYSRLLFLRFSWDPVLIRLLRAQGTTRAAIEKEWTLQVDKKVVCEMRRCPAIVTVPFAISIPRAMNLGHPLWGDIRGGMAESAAFGPKTLVSCFESRFAKKRPMKSP